MQKIPTLFKRDPETHLVVDEVNPECQWVLDGEGKTTRKFDGSPVLARGDEFYKRRQSFRDLGDAPEDWILAGTNINTGAAIFWVPLGDGKEDRWVWEAITNACHGLGEQLPIKDGTYEACGPHFNGNNDGLPCDDLLRHGDWEYIDDACGLRRNYGELRAWLDQRDIEGLVFHHPDGRMSKIKKKDFGLKRTPDNGKCESGGSARSTNARS